MTLFSSPEGSREWQAAQQVSQPLAERGPQGSPQGHEPHGIVVRPFTMGIVWIVGEATILVWRAFVICHCRAIMRCRATIGKRHA
jgi:hypothetical protein